MQVSHRFRDRYEAGSALALRLAAYYGSRDTVVLALPRGGVPVAYEIAIALRLPLDVFEVRKLGVPEHEELAMGAIGSGGTLYLNHAIVDALHIGRGEIDRVIARERAELDRRSALYRNSRPRPEIRGKSVIVVDDGVATGASMIASIAALRAAGVDRVIVAVPVAPVETSEILRSLADELFCLQVQTDFASVGDAYERFEQVGDDEVRGLLHDAASRSR